MHLTKKHNVMSGVKYSTILGFSAILSVSVFVSACGPTSQSVMSKGMPSVTGSIKKAVPHTTRARKKVVSKKLKQAISYWGKAYTKDPKNAQFALNYAQNLKFAGQETQALHVLTRAQNFNRDNKKISGEMGRLLLKNGDVNRAEQLLNRGLDRKNPDWKILSGLGTINAKKGQYDQARAYFGQALSKVPNKPSILVNIATTYMLENKAAEAESYLRRAYAAKPTRRTQRKLKQVLLAQGKTLNGGVQNAAATAATKARNLTQTPSKIKAQQAGAPATTASVKAVSQSAVKPLDISKK